jgi:antitoxin component of MazEF toxin-antitoxin module
MATATALKVRTSEDDVSVTLPQAMLDRLGLQPGQQMQLVEEEDGIAIRPKRVKVADGEIDVIGNYDGIDLSKVRVGVIEAARKVMRENHDVLRRLAE